MSLFRTSLFVMTLLLFLVAAAACRKNSGNESRSPGEVAFRTYCQTCHVLPRPSMKTDEEWPALVARYGDRAKLNSEQIAAITSYLIAAN